METSVFLDHEKLIVLTISRKLGPEHEDEEL